MYRHRCLQYYGVSINAQDEYCPIMRASVTKDNFWFQHMGDNAYGKDSMWYFYHSTVDRASFRDCSRNSVTNRQHEIAFSTDPRFSMTNTKLQHYHTTNGETTLPRNGLSITILKLSADHQKCYLISQCPPQNPNQQRQCLRSGVHRTLGPDLVQGSMYKGLRGQ